MKDKYFVQIYLSPDYIEETDTIEDDVVVGTASFMEVYPMFIGNNCVKIRLYDLDIPNEKVLEGLKLSNYSFVMEFCFCRQNCIYASESVWARINYFFLPFGKTNHIEFYIKTYTIFNYDQAEVNFIQQWIENSNQKFDWRSSSALLLHKYSYLRACASWSNLKIPFSSSLNPSFIIQGEEVKDEDDFYILMGEAFCGDKGYMGTNLNALEDMLRFYYWQTNKPIREILKPTLILENYPHLLRTLGDNFMWHIDDIFSTNRFLIIKK